MDLRERSKDSDLDCHLSICAGGDSQETSQSGTEPLHNFTDLKCHTFREDAHFTALSSTDCITYEEQYSNQLKLFV